MLNGKITHTIESLVSNKNELIDSNKAYNMNIPEILLTRDSAEFDRWDPQLGWWAMDAIMRLEAKVSTGDDKEFELPEGTKLIKLFEDRGFGYGDSDKFLMLLSVASNPDMLVIICRGTNSRTEWLEDMEYALSPVELLGTAGNDYYEDVMVHDGFLKMYLSMRDGLLEEVNNFSDKPFNVFITGHSSGAAISAIISADLERNSPKVRKVLAYLFGCPRPGNIVFRKYIESKDRIAIHRITNTSDIIPEFPLSIAPNVHDPENPFPYNHVGILHAFSSNRHSFNANHFLSTYADWLQKETEKLDTSISR